MPDVFVCAPADVRKIVDLNSTPTRAIAGLVPGVRMFGLTKGQYSLLDLIRAVLVHTGPADVRLSTWSTGIRDAETAAWMMGQGDIASLQLLVDRSFPGRQPQYAGRVTALFGDRAIVITRIHAKIALIKAGDWRIVIRSSMNLNRNPRFEQWDLDDDAGCYDFVAAWFDELSATAPHGLVFDEHKAEEAFQRALVGEASDAEIIAELTGSEPVAPRPPAQQCGLATVEGLSGDVVDLPGGDFRRWLLTQALHGLASAEPGSASHASYLREVREVRASLDTRLWLDGVGKRARSVTR